MQLATYHPSTSAVWADALFVSVLQRSDEPDAGQVRKAIAAVVRAYENLGSDALRGNPRQRANQSCNLAAYLVFLGALDVAVGVGLEALRDAYDSSDQGLLTLALQHIAAAIARSDPKRAARLLGYVNRAFGATGFKRETTELRSYDVLMSALHDALSSD